MPTELLSPVFLMCSILLLLQGAGSDVAGLATRAERKGNDWVLNGFDVNAPTFNQAKNVDN